MISNRVYLAAKVLLLKAPFWRRSSDYCRYLIVCRARSGSNLLRGLLNSHRHVLALGELFRGNGERIGVDLPFTFQSRRDRSLIGASPVRYLEERIFKAYPHYLSAVGFKALYAQLLREERRPVLDYLRDREDLKVIHLKRKDALRTYLSHIQARQHGQWINTSGRRQRHQPLEIDVDDFLDYHRTAQDQQEQYDELFRSHQQIELFYEELAADLTGEMRRIQDFLGVEAREAVPLTYKQSYLPLAVAISNYAEIRERLAPFISASDRAPRALCRRT